MTKNLFKIGQTVRHLKSGNEYKILSEPDEKHKLECCNESFYSYGCVNSIIWYRRKNEMEDGRFK